MSTAESPNISANAGDEKVLSDPNSPESISRRAKQTQVQSNEDQRYDAPPPPRESAGFRDYIIVWDHEEKKRAKEIMSGMFLALGVVLFLYKAAPDGK
jgi:hypothetical protein